MIQRKQTLFLLAVALIAISMFFVPFIVLAGDTHNENIFLSSVLQGYNNSNIYYPLILNFIVIILSVIIIFLYKNRVLQYKLSNLLIVFNVFITGLFFILSFEVAFGTLHSYSFGAFLPIISAVFAYLAAHFIKKDEQLVRSADRIR